MCTIVPPNALRRLLRFSRFGVRYMQARTVARAKYLGDLPTGFFAPLCFRKTCVAVLTATLVFQNHLFLRGCAAQTRAADGMCRSVSGSEAA
ncbi:hypothetical protein [Pseudoprevotella muciniphila]|uniref:hypothetical protein n=1 Tax=Pseudoprevotella muciniphila TaxID=2133944 RepID=UPI0011BD051D|nr:hypothetical protein [Pseudoprevotella muciniphila]